MCNAKITRYRKSEKPKKMLQNCVVRCSLQVLVAKRSFSSRFGCCCFPFNSNVKFKECHFAASTLSIELSVNELNVSRLLLFLRFFAAESVQF